MAGELAGGSGVARTPLRLLLIDDIQSELEKHRTEMEQLGYQVKPLLFDSRTARLGLVTRAVAEFRPDAVLTDWQLGDSMLTGESVAHMFGHEYAHFPKIPVVMHTSDSAAFENNFSDGWKNSDECGHMLGVVEKGRHEDIHRLFSEYFREHPPATGVSNEQTTQRTHGRG